MMLFRQDLMAAVFLDIKLSKLSITVGIMIRNRNDDELGGMLSLKKVFERLSF